MPHQVKRSLLVRYWGITPFDFEGKPFELAPGMATAQYARAAHPKWWHGHVSASSPARAQARQQ